MSPDLPIYRHAALGVPSELVIERFPWWHPRGWLRKLSFRLCRTCRGTGEKALPIVLHGEPANVRVCCPDCDGLGGQRRWR